MERQKNIRAHRQKRLNKLAELEGKAVLDVQHRIDSNNVESRYAFITLKKLGWKKESEILHDDVVSDYFVELIVMQKTKKLKFYKVIPHYDAMYNYN